MVVCIIRVRIFMSENIPSMVDWYYWMPYTKLAGAKGVNAVLWLFSGRYIRSYAHTEERPTNPDVS